MSLQLGHISLTLQDVIGESFAVLGIKGSGKTNTSAVLIEDLIESVPFTIIDPEGEYYGLKERYPILIAGAGREVELPVGVEQAGLLADLAYRKGLSVILDLSGFRRDDRHDFLVAYLRAVWNAASELRRPHFVLLEEARQFIPQQEKSDLRWLLTDYATMGRKRGLGLIVVNQRSSNISKDVLTQAGILLLHRVAHNADMVIYKDLIPGLSGKEVEDMVRGLQTGQCIYVHGMRAEVVSIRQRHTFHAGATPGIEQPPMRTIDTALLDELRKLLASKSETVPVGTVSKGSANTPDGLEKLVKAMAEEIKALEKRIKDLEAARTSAPAKTSAPRRVRQPEPVMVSTGSQPAFTVGKMEFVEGSDEPDTDLSKEAIQRRAAAAQRARTREQNALNKVSDKVENLSKHQKVMLAFLIDNPHNKWMNNRLIARLNGYSETFYVSKIPYDLLDMGILERSGSDYRVSAEFWNRYPSLGREHVIVQLSKRCE